jgi:hypothetical protein
MILDLKLKLLEENTGELLQHTGIGRPQKHRNKSKNRQIGLHQNKNLHSKGNNAQSKETTYSEGKYLQCVSYMQSKKRLIYKELKIQW